MDNKGRAYGVWSTQFEALGVSETKPYGILQTGGRVRIANGD